MLQFQTPAAVYIFDVFLGNLSFVQLEVVFKLNDSKGI